jgi:histone acetyltransferase (RNA polymerase elongator complex component)
MGQRITIHTLPNDATPCPKGHCIYNEAGSCDSPQTNKGNSDAACFRMSNKSVIAFLMISVLKRT